MFPVSWPPALKIITDTHLEDPGLGCGLEILLRCPKTAREVLRHPLSTNITISHTQNDFAWRLQWVKRWASSCTCIRVCLEWSRVVTWEHPPWNALSERCYPWRGRLWPTPECPRQGCREVSVHCSLHKTDTLGGPLNHYIVIKWILSGLFRWMEVCVWE